MREFLLEWLVRFGEHWVTEGELRKTVALYQLCDAHKYAPLLNQAISEGLIETKLRGLGLRHSSRITPKGLEYLQRGNDA